MPFGKFKGVLLVDLPDEYLRWLRTLNDLREPLRAGVEAEWEPRFAEPTIAGDPLPDDVKPMALEIVTAGYRQMARDHHPDRGGETRVMQLINAAADWLRRQVRRAPTP